MKKETFKYFQPYFSPKENFGDIERVQWYHVKHLFDLRDAMHWQHNWPMIIHCCYEKDGHSENSYHYKGLATDFHFSTDAAFERQYEVLRWYLLKLELWNFVGLGTYPDWNSPGFHIDSRGENIKWVHSDNKYYYGEEAINRVLGNKSLGRQS